MPDKIGIPKRILFGILISLLIVVFIMDMFIGSMHIPISEIIKAIFTGSSSRPEWTTIILDYRMPKAFAALLAGMALSVSGLQMQTMFRNPLAGPDVLGISAGASLGVALLVLGLSAFGINQFDNLFNNGSVVIAACTGAAISLTLVMLVSVRVREIMTILILGILVGSAISSVVSILQYFGSETMLKSFIVWTMGSLTQVSKSQLTILVPCVFTGLLLSFLSVKKLNALLLGEKYASTLGLNITSTRILVFTSTSILAGSITAFCGPIAFIGIAVPHVCRTIFRTSDHKILFWASLLVGAIVLVISDIISQLPGTGYTLPINSITALLGIPVIVWIILRNQKQNTW